MELGFETIGNATVIGYDKRPVLATDPWTEGDAYFGSWTVSHDIPREQREAIDRCEYIWISHGHPDHLNARSLGRLPSNKKILLPDHYGGRIHGSLKEQGYRVEILPDRRWTKLSDRIRILCISDCNQDGILLIDVGGRLVVDMNDASDNGWGAFVRRVVKGYDRSFLLKLSGFGDADMINLFDGQGKPILPRAAKRIPVGLEIGDMMRRFGANHFIPFSSMHKYQRKDSVWANRHTTDLADYAVGFDPKAGQILPAFTRYDCSNDRWEKIDPPESPRAVRDPGDFGDDWSEPLEQADVAAARGYFRAIAHLHEHFDFINLRVGGRDNVVELAGKKFDRGIAFEAPRRSLMTSIREEIFDDMLIGNFMKTTLHGDFPQTGLYPDFTTWVAKYGDNGRAKSPDELKLYFDFYRSRAPYDYFRHRLEKKSIETMRTLFRMDSAFYRLAKGAYHLIKDR